MRILQVLYYYEPYTSGLTIYAARLARAFAARGHAVRVLASRHDPALPREETTPEGIRITRLPVGARLDRAVIMPRLLPSAARLMREADVVHLHLPMAEAAPLAALGRLLRRRVIVTHHADLVLTGSPIAHLAARAGEWSGIVGGRLASAFVTSTASRAEVSPTVTKIGDNLEIIPPPVEVATPTPGAREAIRRRFALGSGPVIGYAGRYAVEKGLDVLLQAIPRLRDRFPEAIVALAGPAHDARDGTPLRGPWDSWLRRYGHGIRQIETLAGQDLADFYAACDVLVLPSTNWTETFGMVQVEAMLCGTPVVASDLPGVREPVMTTGAGRLARPGDVDDLTAAILDVLAHPARYRQPVESIRERYGLEATIDAYERLYAGEPVAPARLEVAS